MLRLAFVLVFTAALPGSASAVLFCREPSAPYCATTYGAFLDRYAFDDCKREMETLKDETETFMRCLRDASDKAVRDYNDAVESFNRRARE